MKNGDKKSSYRHDCDDIYKNKKEKQIIYSKLIKLKKTPFLGKDFSFKNENNNKNEKQIEIKKLNLGKINKKMNKNLYALSTSRISKFINYQYNFKSAKNNIFNKKNNSCENLTNTNNNFINNNTLKNSKRRCNSQKYNSTIDSSNQKCKNTNNNLLFLDFKICLSKANKNKFENCKNTDYKNNKYINNTICNNYNNKKIKSNNEKNVSTKLYMNSHRSFCGLTNSKSKGTNFNIKDYISFFIQQQKKYVNRPRLNKHKTLTVGVIGQLIDDKIKKYFSRNLITDRIGSHYTKESFKNYKKY